MAKSNVRELRNALERAMILADGQVLRSEHLLLSVAGNRRAAAAKLGIGLRTLYDKLKRYDLR